MSRCSAWTTGTLAIVLIAAGSSPVRAQERPPAVAETASVSIHSPIMSDSALDARTTAVAEQLRCPVCQGESIQASPSELAGEMRNLVKQQLAQGQTPDQIKAYFVSKYGEWILLNPRAHGFNLVLYAAPYVMLIVGLGVIVIAVRRWTKGETA